jgi:pyocin large subunit-like protein
MGGGVPPTASPGVVPADSTGVNAVSGKHSYVPSNATINSGDSSNVDANSNENSSFWSSTKNKTSVENAYDHSVKHGAELPENQDSVQYVRSAQDFVSNRPGGTLVKTRPNGDTLYYDPTTNTFASKNKDGALKAMVRPAGGMNY